MLDNIVQTLLDRKEQVAPDITVDHKPSNESGIAIEMSILLFSKYSTAYDLI
jgi:hypothetical protein